LIACGAYAIVQLGYSVLWTQSILNVDNRILEYQKALGDLLAPEPRRATVCDYER
jgi:hypothetical protein